MHIRVVIFSFDFCIFIIIVGPILFLCVCHLIIIRAYLRTYLSLTQAAKILLRFMKMNQNLSTTIWNPKIFYEYQPRLPCRRGLSFLVPTNNTPCGVTQSRRGDVRPRLNYAKQSFSYWYLPPFNPRAK